MLPCVVALMLTVAPAAQSAVPGATPVAGQHPDRRADAYFEFLRGRHLEGEGDIEGAIKAFRQARALDPRSAEIPAELAAFFARQNQATEAVAAAEDALALDPANVEAHWVLGTVFAALAQGNSDGSPQQAEALDKAILHLEKARPARRYHLGLSLGLGRLYLRKGDFPKAIDQLKWVADQEPGAAEVAYLLAQAYEGAGQRADAVAVLRQAVRAEPRFFRAWVTLGELLEKSQEYREASEAYARAAAQSPGSVEVRLRQASAQLAAGQTVAARDLLRQLATDAPTDGAVLYLLSDAERQVRDYDEAETAAKRLIALEPTRMRGPFALSQVYEARREYRKVIDTLEPAVARASTSGEPGISPAPLYLRLGFAHQALGEFEPAVEAFERARRAGGGDALFDAYLAQALIAAGQHARALGIIRPVRQARPDDFRFARLEADALAEGGDVDLGLAILDDQVTRQARLDAYLQLAALAMEHDRFDRAERALSDAEQKFPGDQQVAFQRGALFERQKRYADAEQSFRAALSKDPLHGPTLNYLGYMFAERGERLDEAISFWNGHWRPTPGTPPIWTASAGRTSDKGTSPRRGRYLSLAAERLPRNSVVQDHWGDVLLADGDRTGAVDAWERALAGDRESIEPAAIQRKIDDARRPKP